jgi:hypothetical protein
MRICSVEGCEEKHRTKGFCIYHYDRFRNGLTLEARGPRFAKGQKCIHEDCDSIYIAKGYCDRHYRMIKKQGKIIKSIYDMSEFERFNTFVSYNKDNGCIEWIRSIDEWGYGQFRSTSKKKIVRAHRFIYEHHYGAIPPDLIICHKCDNPRCVNISHLFCGTHQDNSDDKIRKGRHLLHKNRLIGENNL